jgi:hypothetical protein
MLPLRFLSIALISVSLLGLEMIWTRIFSAEFFYTFAFLTLSLAVMGLGLGALALRLFTLLNKDSLVGPLLALSGLMAIAGPPLVVKLGLDFSTLFASWVMSGKFLLTIALLSSVFLFAGIALALYFRRFNQDMPRLYMADLLGAGAGVVLAIWFMNWLSTPVAAFLFAVPILTASLITSPRWLKLAPVALIGLAFYLGPQGKNLLEADRQELGRVIYKHWDALAKLKVYDFDGYYRGFNIDNVANSPVFPFDGRWDPDDTASSGWNIDVRYLVKQFDSCTFLSLGSGGGSDVLQALEHRATEVHAVEVNPHMNYMMTFGDTCRYLEYEALYAQQAVADSIAAATAVEAEAASQSERGEETVADTAGVDTAGVADSTAAAEPPPPPPPVFRDSTGDIITLAAYSGYIYSDPRVKVITEDARTYVRRFRNKFDLIYSTSSNTWAALGSGSFALAENYIFTKEAFVDYWEALTEGGFLVMEHQMYMPRIVAEVMEALAEVGVEDPGSRFAVYDLPDRRRNLLLLSRRPLTDSLRYYAFGELSKEVYGQRHLLYPAPDSLAGNIINRIVTEGWEAAAESSAIDISPCTDDRPYVAQLGQWKNFEWAGLQRVSQYADFRGFPLSKMVIVIILLVVVLVMIPLNLIPYFMKGPKLGAVPWLYFFAIGVGFMMIEVVLIQKYALLIGASVYSIATVLFTMLLASGIGSRFARQVPDRIVFVAILVWLGLDVFVAGWLTPAAASLPILGRAAVVALWTLPLGFFMGMPFPKGTLRVGELIDWGFSVNGTASVFGATLIVLIAFSFGFGVALLTGGLVYLLAWLLLAAKSAWRV